jgi:hypothetical protein
MSRKIIVSTVCLAAAVAAVAGAMGFAQPGTDHKKGPAGAAPAAGQPNMQLPPGWTPEDMAACQAAGTPGPMHAWLAKGVGTWQGKEQMWMAPNTPAINSECTQTITSIMDGRFSQCTVSGDMMGQPFLGMGTTGYDNVTQKFVSTWFDNCGTGIMNGTGELSSDQKTLTINYTMNCPITKKPAAMREVITVNSDTSSTMEMFSNDPKTGKEFKMLHIDFTKKK